MATLPVYPRLVKRVKVFDEQKISIPVEMMRSQGIREGDSMQWVELSQGTFILERSPTPPPGYRSFTPG